MIRVLGTVFAALLGLAFGSFLNVCLSRWPEGESIVHPRSHCRKCSHVLAWWENVPLVSWLALRGRCRGCGAWIGWRYVIVEAAVGTGWGITAWQTSGQSFEHLIFPAFPLASLLLLASKFAFMWLLIGLAVLDAEHLWLPDLLTIPGLVLGLVSEILHMLLAKRFFITTHSVLNEVAYRVLGILAAAALILFVRWAYWLLRHREGLGLGDAKLVALLAAWLGFSGALLSLGIGVLLGALLALLVLLVPRHRLRQERWAVLKMPLGTFLCIGGIVSAFWGQTIISAYLRWAGF
jgi:leader peptidase (prepilin peptidase)/N-methyltransferase